MKTYDNMTTLEIGNHSVLESRRLVKCTLHVGNVSPKEWMKNRMAEVEPLAYSFKLAFRTACGIGCPPYRPIYDIKG